METRDQLVEKLDALRSEEGQLRKKIDMIDYEEKFAVSNQYVGRFFKENHTHDDGYRTCLYVYGVEKVNCQTESLSISYCVDHNHHFDVDYSTFFHPRYWDEEDKYSEITKEEFLVHYAEVMKRIELVTKTIK